MDKKLFIFVKSLINHCYISSVSALIATLQKQIPFIEIEVEESCCVECLYLKLHFDTLVITFKLHIEKRANNSFYIQDIER